MYTYKCLYMYMYKYINMCVHVYFCGTQTWVNVEVKIRREDSSRLAFNAPFNPPRPLLEPPRNPPGWS